MNSDLSWYEDEYLENGAANFTKISHKKNTRQDRESSIKRKQKEKLKQKEKQLHNQDKFFN